ncbi:hypothetical protein AAHA92_05950 [Salvia divinorum]|uniref:Uncharacterized protein n=1 Tax=Salvia divinorum TaxID=28513 RepID=A0ABD1I423_SALDI
MASDEKTCEGGESAGSGETNPRDDGWVNPRRPLTRPIVTLVYRCNKPAGGGESLTGMLERRKTQSFSPCRSLVAPIDESAGKARCLDAAPTAMTLRSGGLSSCVTLQDVKAYFELILEKDVVAVAEAETESFSNVFSPIYFPWPMTGESWEASKVEAERQMKEEGFSCFNSPNDDLNSFEEIEKRKNW